MRRVKIFRNRGRADGSKKIAISDKNPTCLLPGAVARGKRLLKSSLA